MQQLFVRVSDGNAKRLPTDIYINKHNKISMLEEYRKPAVTFISS